MPTEILDTSYGDLLAMVFPIGDDNTGSDSFPIVNITLIVINVLVFVFLQGLGSNDNFTLAYSTVPAEIVSGKDLVFGDQIVQMETVSAGKKSVFQDLRKHQSRFISRYSRRFSCTAA